MAGRTAEVVNLYANADALSEGAQVIYAGDFNLHGSTEAAWDHMVAPGPGQAVDLADARGLAG